MPLTLSMKTEEDFFVGDTRVILSHKTDHTTGIFYTPSGSVEVGQQQWVTILPGVTLRTSPARYMGSNLRVEIEAPNYRVLRGSIYRKMKEEA